MHQLEVQCSGISRRTCDRPRCEGPTGPPAAASEDTPVAILAGFLKRRRRRNFRTTSKHCMPHGLRRKRASVLRLSAAAPPRLRWPETSAPLGYHCPPCFFDADPRGQGGNDWRTQASEIPAAGFVIDEGKNRLHSSISASSSKGRFSGIDRGLKEKLLGEATTRSLSAPGAAGRGPRSSDDSRAEGSSKQYFTSASTGSPGVSFAMFEKIGTAR